MIMREHAAYVSVAMAVGTAAAGYLPTYRGRLHHLRDVGRLHCFETANQALALQLLPKSEAPKVLGKVAIAAAQLVAYSLIALLSWVC